MSDDQAKETLDANAEAEKRMAASTPTPTQTENDLAKVGAHNIDDKQDDGSGPAAATRALSPAPAASQAGGYRTRAPAAPPVTGGSGSA